MPEMQDLKMAKFYVVDGISYPAAETAVGCFGRHGNQSQAACRGLGFDNARSKGSLSLGAFIDHVILCKPEIDSRRLRDQVSVNPMAYYLANRGFGVDATEIELKLSEFYLVNGLTYMAAQKKAGIGEKKGFEAMYAVCKLGAFRGRADNKSMTTKEFGERLEILNLGK